MRRRVARAFAALGLVAGLGGVGAGVLALVLWGDLGSIERSGALAMGAFGLTYIVDARRDWRERW